MKCGKCQTVVLEGFRFCQQCGTFLTNAKRLGTTDGSPREADASSSKPKRAETPLLSFDEFRKRKSKERQENSKKKKENPPKEVLINVGIMNLVKQVLKPIKGKVMMVRVNENVRKLELLKKSFEKHSAHDRNFDQEADYTIVYPDGTEILTLPGQPNQLFQLDKYKQDIGKPYNRITIYLAKRCDQELFTKGESDTESDSSNEKVMKQISMLESFARGSMASSHTCTNDILQNPSSDLTTQPNTSNIPSVQEQLTIQNTCKRPPIIDITGPSRSATPLVDPTPNAIRSDLQSLKEMFPAKQECELRQAMDITSSLEEAINFLVEDRSLNVVYGSLLSEELEVDADTYHDEENLLTETKTLFTTNENLGTKLENWKNSNMDGNGHFRLKVRRQEVWDDTLTKLNKANSQDTCKPIKVQFIGEPAVDQGGPSREFFSLINANAQRKLMSKSVFRHNISALQRKEYYAFGQLTALGILQGSPGPKYFSKTVVDYIFSGCAENLQPTVDEIPNTDIKDCLQKLEKVSDADEFKRQASFECDFRFEAGFTKPIVTIDDKEDFLKCITLHYTVLVCLSEINQFVEGLKTCNLLSLIQESPEMFRSVFQVSSAKLTAEDLDNIFEPVFSPASSNRFAVEQNIIFNFNQYLEDVEQGKVISQLQGMPVTITLNQILEFVTGAYDVPAISFSPHPTIEFLHDEDSTRKMSANTCANVLKLPVKGLCDEVKFAEEFTFCMLNSPGFGFI